MMTLARTAIVSIAVRQEDGKICEEDARARVPKHQAAICWSTCSAYGTGATAP
ncbi:hypothetical protein PCA20602_01329 [Pandoraea capi]|uniref:Uncharacterized protein n=1 Tax=Pandoraea capi TaxID=2508286 RepID=A0ABY6VT08_9BURK|nr:hypothetical protein PCA20602_01329 [Pandoraea capi]